MLMLYLSLSVLAATVPIGWKDAGEAPADASIELSFFLKLPRHKVAVLESELLARATPSSPRYGSGWLSNEEVHAMVAPPEEALATVEAWLVAEAGVSPIRKTPNGDIITAVVPVRVAESLLGADYRAFTHAASNTTVIRCLSYTLPHAVNSAIAIVGPTSRFHNRGQNGPRPTDLVEQRLAAGLNNPSTLRALYSVNDVLGGTAPSNRQAVTAFLEQFYDADAEQAFFDNLFPHGAGTPLAFVGDAIKGPRPGVEAMLDIEYMPAMGALNPTEFWGFSGTSPISAADEPFLKWLYLVGNTSDDKVPLVFSTSYGEDEGSEVGIGDYSERINVEFVKGGARGISFLFASGDSGAAAMGSPCKFSPKWPAASPWVTAVGGTLGVAMPEESWTGSSGGFSDAFGTPTWQKGAVAAYLTNATGQLPDASMFNSSGRGFPDISAASVQFPVYISTQGAISVAGTSCASPTASGIFGLLNDKRLHAGKSSLGFLNPMLYAAPVGALTDVQSGSQRGCHGNDGFPAVKGWDAVTGLGTPNFKELLAYLISLP